MTDKRNAINGANPLGPLEGVGGEDLGADPMFADRLEASLRVAHAQLGTAQPVWRRIAVVAPAMIVLLAVASVLLLARGESPSAALVLTDATNVTVHLPDGTSVDDPADGFLLVDGAVLEIRDGGAATVDEITVDTAAVFTVRDGLLVSDVVGTTTTDQRVDSTTSAPVTDRGTTSASVRDRDTPATTTRPRATDAPPPAPPSTRAVDRQPPDTPVAPVDQGHDPPPPAPSLPPDIALQIGLRLSAGDGGVSVGWSIAGAHDNWTMMLLRRTGDAVPGIGPDSALDAILGNPLITVLAEGDGAGSGEFFDAGALGDGPVRYRVLVLDAGRGIVGSSPSHSIGR